MILWVSIIFVVIRNLRRFTYEKPNVSGNYLLLIAHPDDESMFFAPTLMNLRGRIRIICLSKGDYMSDGEVRSKEMINLCSKYRFELIFGNLKDNHDWDPQDIVNILFVTYLLDPFKILITFDSHGVSGHKNHISCYYGAKSFSKLVPCRTMFLKSTNLISKYGVLYNSSKLTYTLSFRQYFNSIIMMSYHYSQLKWFRLIYMAFSNYMSYNLY
ncbi:N-acetylglucosaminyl-phosphatidylinositol de-N-acetylase [Nosema bombycis CQ1]|uniref:N-acetylglucosaminylphosphatidylinositol deacetylase n=1 Tax=Nosema bombycis (strain CQ1 / CVCC 102059) TaxID=578461 RepID=R0KPD6_NOSB1|nr:N-acetylglucosaminyl-phosphatidylinositol de-N-acetylase [Nosema bombycis CQ1]|eukprot:EOB12052.1 N-acetylglucosaminyl-phosphatidylinositol de-N-acetylase [Nosema bombycis CQ1]